MAKKKPKKPYVPKAHVGAVPATPEQIRAILEGRDQALTIKTVKQRFNVKGDTTIYELVRRNVLPRPVKIGGASRWLVSQIGAAA